MVSLSGIHCLDLRSDKLVLADLSRCDRNGSSGDRSPQYDICALSTVMARVSDIIPSVTKEHRGLIHTHNIASGLWFQADYIYFHTVSTRTLVPGGLHLLSHRINTEWINTEWGWTYVCKIFTDHSRWTSELLPYEIALQFANHVSKVQRKW
jgi:hypothetical protein